MIMASQDVLKSLETLHKELEKLEPAVRHVQAAEQVTEMVRSIPEKHVELLDQLKKADEELKQHLKEDFTFRLESLTKEHVKLHKETEAIQEMASGQLKHLEEALKAVKGFHDKVDRINFPERLDKLDANVAGIMAAVQSVQSRIDSAERNIADRVKDLIDYHKESRAINEKLLGRLSVLAYITWGLVILAILSQLMFR